LFTHNNTDKTSTVKITSDATNRCSVQYPFSKATLPHATSRTTAMEARTICNDKLASKPCEADMYDTPNCDGSGAKPMAHLKIDLNTMNVTVDQMSVKAPYAVIASGSDVTIKYAGK
jgi:hypothetical protein